MANVYVRSLFWLTSLTGLGYGLLLLTSPSQEDFDKLKKDQKKFEQGYLKHLTKEEQFNQVLLSASNSGKPLYRMTKQEIDREIERKN